MKGLNQSVVWLDLWLGVSIYQSIIQLQSLETFIDMRDIFIIHLC